MGRAANALCFVDSVVNSLCHLLCVRTGVYPKLRVAVSWSLLCTSLLCDLGMVTPFPHTCSLLK